MVECVVTGLSDEYPKYLRRYKWIFLIGVCVLMFLLAIPMCAEVGTEYSLWRSRVMIFIQKIQQHNKIRLHTDMYNVVHSAPPSAGTVKKDVTSSYPKKYTYHFTRLKYSILTIAKMTKEVPQEKLPKTVVHVHLSVVCSLKRPCCPYTPQLQERK